MNKHFPEEYEEQNEIDTCRFWMMCKMRYQTVLFNNRFELYLLELKARLFEMNPNKKIVKEEIDKIQLRAYNTINGEFFNTKDYKSSVDRLKTIGKD